MSKKLFVGGLSWGTDESTLRSAFEQFGQVSDAVVITDSMTGRSRGFGFVTYDEESAAQRAIEEMNGTELDGRRLNVSEAQERRPRGDGGGFGGGPPGGGGGGGGGGRRPRGGGGGGGGKGRGGGGRDRGGRGGFRD